MRKREDQRPSHVGDVQNETVRRAREGWEFFIRIFSFPEEKFQLSCQQFDPALRYDKLKSSDILASY